MEEKNFELQKPSAETQHVPIVLIKQAAAPNLTENEMSEISHQLVPYLSPQKNISPESQTRTVTPANETEHSRLAMQREKLDLWANGGVLQQETKAA